MTDRQTQKTAPTSETARLAQIQTATRVFAFLLNLAALTICLFLLRHFRSQALQPSFLFTSLFFVSAFLILSGILFLALGWVERHKLAIESRSFMDERTGALTAQAFEKVLTEEMRRAGRYHYPVTVCLLDLDDFLSFNQHFGTEKGDLLLRSFSELLRSTVRFSDTVGRAAKDGFFILLPHTDLVRAQKFLGRALKEAQEKLDAGFSAGLTTYQAGEKQTDLLSRLELAIAAAKREGKKKIRSLVPGQDSQAVLSF